MTRRLLLAGAGFSLLSPRSCGGAPPRESTEQAADTTGAAAAEATHPPDAASSPAAPPAAAAAAPAVGRPQAVPMRAPLGVLSTTDRLLALTIDDGPDPTYTPAVLKILDEHRIAATFFLVGENAARYPDLVREIAARGHHIANHTWSHPDLRSLSETAARDELGRTSDLLYATTGRAPTWFRAPGGDFTEASLRFGAELGMRPMSWSVDPRDWSRPGSSTIVDRILTTVGSGSILLNHDGGGDRAQTVTALRAYLPVLIGQGYQFTTPH
ncbi:polysaccharide deacetylase family protein [Kitasatospora sp. NPDC088346]|uniref:polysaccharide deacetylase family protein n=1 Tax=Kitasatospora sp. NPDC088346 TaxID=3364073 RepID=UPI0038243340